MALLSRPQPSPSDLGKRIEEWTPPELLHRQPRCPIALRSWPRRSRSVQLRSVPGHAGAAPWPVAPPSHSPRQTCSAATHAHPVISRTMSSSVHGLLRPSPANSSRGKERINNSYSGGESSTPYFGGERIRLQRWWMEKFILICFVGILLFF
jgi:hypothetical protein